MAIKDFHHNLIDNVALPYEPNTSPINPTLAYVIGLNVMTSYKGTLERRPGFPPYTTDTFSGVIARWFEWQRWDGSFYIIVCVTNTGGVTSKVYKLKVGTDTTFQLVDTDSTSSTPFDFVITTNYLFFGNGVRMKRYDGTTVTNWGFATAPTTPTLSSAGGGLVPGAIGHTYVAAFGESATGYIGDISGQSAVTSAANTKWNVSTTGSGESNCDKIHFFRTEDGGATWYEIPASPIANAAGAQTVQDNATDDTLGTQQAPLPRVNQAPASYPGTGFILWQGRIWYIDATSKSTLRYTGFEEVTNGFKPESLPRINSRDYGKEIIGLSVAGPYLMVVTINDIFRISGYSLSSFVYETAHGGLGARNKRAICHAAVAGNNNPNWPYNEVMFWLDISNTIHMSSGIGEQDISIPMNSDITSIDHSQASLVVFQRGLRKWLVLGDGNNSTVSVYDLLTKRWMPPWIISNGVQAIGIGQTSAGNPQLFVGSNGQPLAMNQDNSNYTDAGTLSPPTGRTYDAYATIRLSNVSGGANPSIRGGLQFVGVESDANQPSVVEYLLDEDPQTGSPTFVDVTANAVVPQGRSNGTNLVEFWYMTNLQTQARRTTVRLTWYGANSNFHLYGIDIAYRLGPEGVM